MVEALAVGAEALEQALPLCSRPFQTPVRGATSTADPPRFR